MIGLLSRLLGLKKKKTKKIKAKYLVLDMTEDGIWVRNKFIPRRQIINIDSEKGVIIYKTEDGRIEEIPYKEDRRNNSMFIYHKRKT